MLAGARLGAPGAALAARPGARSRRLGAARRLPRRRRDARGVDPPPPRSEGRRPRALPPRAARNVERPAPAPGRAPARDRVPRPRPDATPTRPSRQTPRGIPSTACPRMAFDHGEIVLAGRERLRAKLSYTNLGFALAPPTFTISELRELYAAALGHEVSATNLQRVLVRRELLEETGERRASGRARRQARDRLPLPLARARGHGSVRRAPPSSPTLFGMKWLRRRGRARSRRSSRPRRRAEAAAAALAVAVRADRRPRRAVALLRAPAARGHRQLAATRRPSCRASTVARAQPGRRSRACATR